MYLSIAQCDPCRYRIWANILVDCKQAFKGGQFVIEGAQISPYGSNIRIRSRGSLFPIVDLSGHGRIVRVIIIYRWM